MNFIESSRRLDALLIREGMRSLLVLLLCLAPLVCRADDDIVVPEGFVLQPLVETDGQIARPKDWFYTSKGTPSGWLWTFSKEDPAQGAYKTGLRLQLLLGVAERSGKTRAQFAEGFIADKRKTSQVLRDCPESDMGQFRRRCIEVLESLPAPAGPGLFHIMYSVMWGKEMDAVVVSTFGTPSESWESALPISNAMAAFRLTGPRLGERRSSSSSPTNSADGAASRTSAVADAEAGWIGKDGSRVEDSPAQRSVSGFGVWLVVTPDEDWAEKWNTPSEVVPSFTTAKEVRRGGKLTILTFLANPKPDERNRLNVRCDIQVTRPDGSISAQSNDLDCMSGPLMGEPRNLRLSNLVVAFSGDPEDILGEWKVAVQVKDMNRGVSVPVSASFTLVER
jgi:hypothetical protein